MAREISKEFHLLEGETVIKRAEKVNYGKPLSTPNHDLILTNRALILTKKSILGKVKEVIRFPLSDVVISGGDPQVKLSKPDNVTAALDVYLSDGIEQFKFTFDQEVEDWIADITEVITGRKVERKTGFEDISDMMAFADNVAGAVNHVKSAFGIKPTEQGAIKCSGCGSSLSGTVGEVLKCPYCGTFNKLEW